jgi:hypothetical protein
MSTPRSTPDGRGEKPRVGCLFVPTRKPLRTFRSTRSGLIHHDALVAWSPFLCLAAAVRIIGKTLSTQAAARTVPPAIRPD